MNLCKSPLYLMGVRVVNTAFKIVVII